MLGPDVIEKPTHCKQLEPSTHETCQCRLIVCMLCPVVILQATYYEQSEPSTDGTCHSWAQQVVLFDVLPMLSGSSIMHKLLSGCVICFCFLDCLAQ